jgi:hypothetical protein
MRTQIRSATMAAAVAAVLVALTLAREVLAEPVEIRVFSSAAPRGVLNEIAPVYGAMRVQAYWTGGSILMSFG